jgi:RNA polymerase sigma-70 factor, ECF subfamily
MRAMLYGNEMTTPMAIRSRREFAAVVEDEASFRQWYDAALPRVYRYLAARCAGDIGLAEELTQQAFVEAIRHQDRFDGRSDVVTWLCAIGRNRLVDHYRRQGRDVRRHERLIATHHSQETDATWRRIEIRDAVERALNQLPDDQRLALLFQHLDGLTVRDVARMMRRSEKATESLLARARDGFRRAYGGETGA